MRMMKKALIATSVLVTVLLAALGVAIATLDLNAYKAQITQRIASATGRELHIDGNVEHGISLTPTIVVEGLRIANAAWGTAPDMLNVARAEAQLALFPLFAGEIQINRLVLHTPTILFETDPRGVSNWDFNDGRPPAEDAGSGRAWRATGLDEVTIRDANLTFHDGRTGDANTLTVGKIDFATEGAGTPVSVEIEAGFNGQAFHAEGTLGKSGQILANQSIDVDLEITSGATKLAIDGNIARPLQGKGLDLGLALRSESLVALGLMVGETWPDAGPVSLSGQLTDTELGHAVTGLEARLAESDLSGNLTLDHVGRPRLSGRLYADRIDLDALRGSPSAAAAGRQERLFSPAPLPLEALAAADADITLDVRQVDTGSTQVENLEATLALQEGRLTLVPLTAEVAGGRANAVVTLAAEDETARLKFDLEIARLEPARLSAMSGTVNGATTDVTLKAEGTGASIAAIMASLDGRLLVQSGPGTLNDGQANTASSDLLLETYRMLDPTTERDTRTRLECVVFHFMIRDGIAITDRGIALATARMNVIGSGAIDLKTERLDIGIVTEAREGVGLSAGQFADLVRLSGTLANPQPTLDTGKTVMTGVSAGAAVATSGLSVLAQGLYDRLTADDAPCQTALAMRIEDTRSTGDRAADAAKGVGESIKGAFKSLFGD